MSPKGLARINLIHDQIIGRKTPKNKRLKVFLWLMLFSGTGVFLWWIC